MRTYDAIEAIGQKVIQSGTCSAILMKGSIGRGDDDQYSDVDLYLIVKQDKIEEVLCNRTDYLKAYKDIVYMSEANFGLPQLVTIYEDGLHVDLYVATEEQLVHSDPIKVYYDPEGLFQDYTWERKALSTRELAEIFGSTLYCMVEADSAYRRKNYAWTARILDQSIADSAVLLRYFYDPDYAFLGLKKLNQILPQEKFELIDTAYANLREEGFSKANECILKILEFVVESADEELKGMLNLKFYEWVKAGLGTILFG